MPTVGRTLAAERVRQGRSLADIAAITKINVNSLQAIEADDFDQLPGRVFARNFVRQYAQELHLDSMHILAQFDHEQNASAPDFALPDPGQSQVPRMPGPPPSLSKILGSNTLSAFVTFLLTIAVCGGAYYLYQRWPLIQRSVHSAAQPTASVVAKTAPQPAAPETKKETGQVPSPATAPAAAAPDTSNVRVALTAIEPCWTRIIADGKTLFAGLLAAGEHKTVDANETVTIRAGNAGGLELKLNGDDVPPLGPKGQIRTITLTQAGAQVRTPTPEPVDDF